MTVIVVETPTKVSVSTTIETTQKQGRQHADDARVRGRDLRDGTSGDSRIAGQYFGDDLIHRHGRGVDRELHDIPATFLLGQRRHVGDGGVDDRVLLGARLHDASHPKLNLAGVCAAGAGSGERVRGDLFDGHHRTDLKSGGLGDVHPDQGLARLRPAPVHVPVPVEGLGLGNLDPRQQVGGAVDTYVLVAVAGGARRDISGDDADDGVALLRGDLGVSVAGGDGDHHQVRPELPDLGAHLGRHR
jgi:hypothetical protein